MTSKTANPYGLEFKPSNVGREADAMEVARTLNALRGGKALGLEHRHAIARHAVALHVISGKLHRLSERQCNEDLACPTCGGSGEVPNHPDSGVNVMLCRACAGTGLTTGRKLAKLEAGAKEIAAHYGLAVYFQGDPRGCSLYLIDPASYKGTSGWVSSNYNHGHAVVRLGR